MGQRSDQFTLTSTDWCKAHFHRHRAHKRSRTVWYPAQESLLESFKHIFSFFSLVLLMFFHVCAFTLLGILVSFKHPPPQPPPKTLKVSCCCVSDMFGSAEARPGFLSGFFFLSSFHNHVTTDFSFFLTWSEKIKSSASSSVSNNRPCLKEAFCKCCEGWKP